MKKSILGVALALAAVASFAAETTGFVKYDYDGADSGVFVSGHRGVVGAKYTFNGYFGSVDGGLVVDRLVSSNGGTSYGVEVGYSNGVKLGPVTVLGRVAYQSIESVNTWRSSVEGSMPVTQTVRGFVGYEYLDSEYKTVALQSDRFTVGGDFVVNPKVSVRLGYARLHGEGASSNGVTTAVNYKF